MQAPGSTEARIQSVYLTAFGRRPTATELETGRQFLALQANELGKDTNHVDVWQDFCHVIFNVKEFIHIK